MMVLQLGLLVAMVSSCLALLHTPSPPPPISSTPSPSPPLPSSSPYTCDSLLGASLCPLEVEHSTVEVRGEELHYWVYQPANFTQTSLLPVLLINGGPGYPHNYLLPMKVLACTGRQVVFYDQVGRWVGWYVGRWEGEQVCLQAGRWARKKLNRWSGG